MQLTKAIAKETGLPLQTLFGIPGGPVPPMVVLAADAAGVHTITTWNVPGHDEPTPERIVEMLAEVDPSVLTALASLQLSLCATVDTEAEAQRAIYITPGSGQAMVYLQKSTEATAALAASAASPPMSSSDGKDAFVLLAAEIGITVDPATGSPATDVFGVARSVQALALSWLYVAAAIETERLTAKIEINGAATVADAQAAYDKIVWPSP